MWLKRVIAVLSVAILIFLGLITGYLIVMGTFGYSHIWRYALSDFDLYAEDFENIVKVVQDHYGEEPDVIISIKQTENGKVLAYQDQVLELDAAEQASFDRILSAFSDPESKLDHIRIFPNRVSFHVTNGQYALVYASDNKKPTFVNSPNEERKVKTKRIHKYWYHIVFKP